MYLFECYLKCFWNLDNQATGIHDQNGEMKFPTYEKIRGANSVDLNKTALRIPVPGTSALAFGCTIAAGTVPQRRLTDGSPLGQGPFIPNTT